MYKFDGPVEIRLARPSDAPDMAEIIMRSWETAYKDILPPEYIREKNAVRPEQYKRAITDENTNSYIIRRGDKTVGVMRIDSPQDGDADGSCYELHNIYLHPDYFRQGIGTLAMEFAFQKARDLGKKIMLVWVISDNINAIRFYEKCGFAADGCKREKDAGKILTSIRMRKSI